MRNPLRSLPRAFVVLGLVASTAVLPATLGAQEDDGDPREQREEVRREKAELATEIDALEAEVAEVEAALAAVAADVRTQEAALDDAERRLAQARTEAKLAAGRVAETEALLAQLEQALTDLAVSAYVQPPSDEAMLALESTSAEDAEARRALLALRSGDASDVIDQVKETRARLEGEKAEAVQREEAAEVQHQAVEAQTEVLRAAYQRQADLVAEVEARLDARLAESTALEELDEELSAEIARREAELAAKLAAQQEAARKAAAARGASVKAPRAPAGVTVPAPGEIVTVRGIQIHASIASELDALLAAAEADGIQLGGGGYRSSARQIELRRAHCGSSHYAIYEAPASSCRPPTARPGQSNHERGLAIDFTCNGGGAINSRSNPCFRWLAANAERFGFYNLPSEPWHWSVNGQ